jgi:hypothetical protein
MNFFTPVMSAQKHEGMGMTQQDSGRQKVRREQIVDAHIHAESSAHETRRLWQPSAIRDTMLGPSIRQQFFGNSTAKMADRIICGHMRLF